MGIPNRTFKVRKQQNSKEITIQMQMNLPDVTRLVYPICKLKSINEWKPKTKKITDESSNNLKEHLSEVAKNSYVEYITKNPNPEISLKEFIRNSLKKAEGKKDFVKTIPTFFEFLDILKNEKIIEKKAKNTIQKYTALKTVLTGFAAHIRKKEVNYNDIDPFTWKSDFMDYCYSKRNMKGNTLDRYLHMLKYILNDAFERGFHHNKSYKSSKFKGENVVATKIYLSDNELDKIYNNPGINQINYLDKTRDLFIIQSDTGLRISDRKNIDEVHIKADGFYLRTQKTNTETFAPHTERTLKILKKYKNILPKISSQKFNDYIKQVCEKAGITDNIEIVTNNKERINVPKFTLVSSHTARRSYVTNSLLNGYSPQSIMAVTGHKTEAQLYAYSCLTQQQKAKIKNR